MTIKELYDTNQRKLPLTLTIRTDRLSGDVLFMGEYTHLPTAFANMHVNDFVIKESEQEERLVVVV